MTGFGMTPVVVFGGGGVWDDAGGCEGFYDFI
jgi:hypothetical protein